MTAPTRQQVEAEGAGRKLDALVAEFVMGWNLVYPKPSPGAHFSSEGDKHKWGEIKPYYSNTTYTPEDWKPSISWSAMREVVEKIKEQRFSVRLKFTAALQELCLRKTENDKKYLLSWSELIFHLSPEKVAKAALLAVIGGE